MKPDFENDEIEIDLLDLFLEVVSHWKVILAHTVLYAVIALVISKFIITPIYESTASLYIVGSTSTISSLTDLQIGSSLTGDYMEIVDSRPVVESVLSNLGINDEYDYEEFAAKISMDNPSDTRILSITVKDKDPEAAQLYVNEMASVVSDFIHVKMDQEAPQIISNGYVADKPSSPSVKKYTLIGAFLGLMLATIFFSVRYLSNDTFMTTEDVEKRLGLSVLASIPMDQEEYNGGSKRRKKKKNKKKSAKQDS